eukprot:Opistho-1_new@61516
MGTGETFFGTSSWLDFLTGTGYKAVCTNLDDRGYTYYADVLQPYYVHTMTLPDSTNVTLGIISFVAEDYCTQTKCEFRIKPTPIRDSLPPVIATLRNDYSVDLVIAISSAGIGVDLPVLAAVGGIDVLIGGKHYRDGSPVYAVPMTAPGPNGQLVHIGASYGLQQTLGNFMFQVVNGRVVASSGGDVVIWACANDSAPTPNCFVPNPTVSALANALKTTVNARIKVVGRNTVVYADKVTCRSVQCVHGDIQADALVAYMSGQCDVAMINSGNIRTNIAVGNLTNFDAEDNIFIGTTVSVVQMKGSTIANAIGISSTRIGLPGFLQFSRGLRVAYDLSRPAGVRVYSISIAERVGQSAVLMPSTPGNYSYPRGTLTYAPLNLNRVYYVCATSFLRTGGDGYTMFRDEAVDALDNGPLMNDAIAAYWTLISPFNITLDGRIKIGPAPPGSKPVTGTCSYDTTVTSANGTFSDLCSGATHNSQSAWMGVAPAAQNITDSLGVFRLAKPRMVGITLTSSYTPPPESDTLVVYDSTRTRVLSVYTADGSALLGRFNGPGPVPSSFYVPAGAFAMALVVTLPSNRSTLAFSFRSVYECPAGYEAFNTTCKPCAANTYKGSVGETTACVPCPYGMSTGGAVGSVACNVALPQAVSSSSSANLALILPIVLCLGGAVLVIVVAFVVYTRRRQRASQRLQRTIIDFNSIEFIAVLAEGSFGVVQKARWRNTEVAVKLIKGLSDQASVEASIARNSEKPLVKAKEEAPVDPELRRMQQNIRTAVQTHRVVKNKDSESSFGIFTRMFVGGSNKDEDDDALPTGSAKSTAKELARRRREFIHEVDIMCSLRHPNVILYMGCCESPCYAIVQEFMSGGDLDSALDKHPNWSLAMRIRMLTDAAKGLQYLHDIPMLHCDLKSPNLLLDAHNVVKVSDFGLSRVRVREEELEGGGIGSILWMAPEAIMGTDYTVYSDVFSFAVIMWELLTNGRPVETALQFGSPASYVVAVAREDLRPSVPEWLPRPLTRLVKRAWDPTPDARPTMANILSTVDGYLATAAAADLNMDWPPPEGWKPTEPAAVQGGTPKISKAWA